MKRDTVLLSIAFILCYMIETCEKLKEHSVVLGEMQEIQYVKHIITKQ